MTLKLLPWRRRVQIRLTGCWYQAQFIFLFLVMLAGAVLFGYLLLFVPIGPR